MNGKIIIRKKNKTYCSPTPLFYSIASADEIDNHNPK
jgi:hypothetical protein